MITNNEINKYIKNIKKQLLYGTKESKQFLKELKQNITYYVEENQNSDMAQVMEQFGKPEDIAATFFEQYGKEDIKKKINIRRAVVAAFAIAIAIFTIYLTIAVINSYKSVNGYAEKTIIEDIALKETTSISAYID